MRARSNSAVRRPPATLSVDGRVYISPFALPCVYISQRAFTFHLLPDPIAKIETKGAAAQIDGMQR